MKSKTIQRNFSEISSDFSVPSTESPNLICILRVETNEESAVASRSPSVETMNTSSVLHPGNSSRYDLLQPVRQWLDDVDVHSPQLARWIAKSIPAQCPFERDIKLFGHKVAHIPPLCKLNPLYDQFVGLRFRALCYLADECGEDIQAYI